MKKRKNIGRDYYKQVVLLLVYTDVIYLYIPIINKGERVMKKDKLITMKVNEMENKRIDFLCNKLNMNRSQMLLYLVEKEWYSIKEDGSNE